LLKLQITRSCVPQPDQILIEYFKDREGFHLLFYPFEGRFVHEGLGALFAYRISKIKPISFSIAMSDYGFELLSDVEIPIEEALAKGLFSTDNLIPDIQRSLNEVEMARRNCRDVASIAGLIFKGFPGKPQKEKHLQTSSSLIFEVYHDHDPGNLLYLQTYEEIRTFQLCESRLRVAMNRMESQEIKLQRPDKATPFAFPIMIDRMRERLTSEKLLDRVAKMKLALER